MDCANCKWVRSTHENALFAHLTCGNFLSVQERNSREAAARLTVVPDRCAKCNEALTPRVTKGAYQCKCDMPKPPRWVLEQAALEPLTPKVRYGN